MYGADIIEEIKLEFRLWYRSHKQELSDDLDEEIVNNYMFDQKVYGEELYASLIEELKKLREENEVQV